MICKKCKQKINKDESVCPHCGEPIKASFIHRAISSLKQMPMRNWLCVVILALAFLIAMAVFAYSFRPGPFAAKTVTISTITEPDNQTAFVYNGKRVEGAVSGSVLGANSSMFGDLLVFKTYENELYMVDKKGLYLVSNNVIAYQMASYGGKIVYLNSVNELYIFTCSNHKVKQIDYNVLSSNISISSGGSAVAYLKEETTGDVMYCYTGGKPEKYAEGRYPVAVSDGLKHLYMVDGSMNLYYASGGKETEVFQNVDSSFVFDNDFSDVLFHSSGASYLYQPGKEAVMIAEKSVALVCSPDIANHTNNTLYSMDTVVMSYGISSFKDKFYTDGEGTLYHVGKKFQTKMIDTGVSVGLVSDNGKKVYYLKGGALTSSTAKGKITVIAEQVDHFRMTGDSRYIYYTDEMGILWGKHGRLKAKKIAENVITIQQSGRDYLFYTVLNQDVQSLYGLKDLSAPKLLSEHLGEVFAFAGSAYYLEDGVRYFSNGNLKFKKFDAETK